MFYVTPATSPARVTGQLADTPTRGLADWSTRGLADTAKRTKTKRAKSPVASASCPVTEAIALVRGCMLCRHRKAALIFLL